MSLVYYYCPMSSAVRTTWAIEELDVPCERQLVDFRKNETKSPAFLKLNPNGKVPLLVVDGHSIFESQAILVYLGETYGVARGLYPAPGVERAECLKWIAWGTASLLDALQRYLLNTSERIPADQRSAKAGEVAKGDLDSMLTILDTALASREYLAGDRFTFADLAVCGFVPYIGFVRYDISRFTNIKAWSERCLGRPAARKANEAPMP
jgi:glutathione S-transferase